MPAKYHTKIIFGASIGTKKPVINAGDSRMDIPVMLYEFCPSEMRPSALPPPMFEKTITLIPQECIFDKRGCCARGNECKFVHTNTLGETVQSCIILDDNTYLHPVQVRTIQCLPCKVDEEEVVSDEEPVVDARIYFAGLTPDLTDTWVRLAVEPFGVVDMVRILPSKCDSGKKAGFIHMTSESGARAAIEHLRTLRLDGVFLKAELQFVGVAPVMTTSPQKEMPNNFISKLASVPCKFFVMGMCSKGKMCKFSHDVGSSEKRTQGSAISKVVPEQEKPRPDADGFTMVSSRTKNRLFNVDQASETPPVKSTTALDNDKDAASVKPGVDDGDDASTLGEAYLARSMSLDNDATCVKGDGTSMLDATSATSFGSQESMSNGWDAVREGASETRMQGAGKMSFVTLPNDAGGDCGLFAIDQGLRDVTESSRAHTNMYRQEIVSFYVSNLKKVAPVGMNWEKFVLGASENATASFADYLAFIEEDGAQIGTAELEALAIMKNLRIEIFNAHDHGDHMSSHGAPDGTLLRLAYDGKAKHYELATPIPPDMPSLEMIAKDRAMHSPQSVILDDSNPWGETTRSFKMRNELSSMRVAGY